MATLRSVVPLALMGRGRISGNGTGRDRARRTWPTLSVGLCLLAVASTGPTRAATSAPPSPQATRSPSRPSTSVQSAPSGPASPVPGLREVVVQRISQLRVESGCGVWHQASPLQRAAETYAHALSVSGTLTHVDALGDTAEDRVRQVGYRGNVIELLASGVTAPDAVAAGLAPWVGQTDLLDCRYRSVGSALDHGYLVVIVGDR